jgi:hypothetical protein
VPLPAGQFATLMLLGTGVNGDQLSQAIRVNYTDGTSSTFTQTFSNWLNASQAVPGQSIALSMAYRNKSSGARDARAFNLYGYSFALASTRPVRNLVLPANNNISILAATLRTAAGATLAVTLPAGAPALARAEAAAPASTHGLSDFNGDGRTDLVFQHRDGRADVWFIKGMVRAGVGSLSAPAADWRLVATGDFDGDGKSDLVWQQLDGRVYIGFMDGATQTAVGWVREQPLAAGRWWRATTSTATAGRTSSGKSPAAGSMSGT